MAMVARGHHYAAASNHFTFQRPVFVLCKLHRYTWMQLAIKAMPFNENRCCCNKMLSKCLYYIHMLLLLSARLLIISFSLLQWLFCLAHSLHFHLPFVPKGASVCVAHNNSLDFRFTLLHAISSVFYYQSDNSRDCLLLFFMFEWWQKKRLN